MRKEAFKGSVIYSKSFMQRERSKGSFLLKRVSYLVAGLARCNSINISGSTVFIRVANVLSPFHSSLSEE